MDDAQGTLFRVEQEERVVEKNVANLYSSRRVRRSLGAFVGPIGRDSVNQLDVEVPGADVVVITPDDRPALDVRMDDEMITGQVVNMILRIEAIRWRSRRWEFREPTIGLLWAAIEDETFLAGLGRGEQFEKGETLECAVRVRQCEDETGGFKSDYTIETVLAHHSKDSGNQLSID